VVISASNFNNTSSLVLVAYISRKSAGRIRTRTMVEVMATGIASYVLCEQIAGVDKSRLMGYMGKLDYSEQKAVDDALEDIIDLGYADETALKEKESEIADRDVLISELQTDVDVAKAELRNKDEEIASLKMEIEMWQKCYGRCMDMLVDTKVNGDFARRVAAPVEPKVEKVEPTFTELIENLPKHPATEDDRLDINNCTATALKKIGFSLAMARKIVQSRPFKSVEDLKRVNGLKGSQYRIMEPKLCCNPMVKKPVEPKMEFVNKEPDPGYEVEESVVIEEVVETPEITETPVVAEPRRVNVNDATAAEISEVTGINKSQCSMIVSYRKKHGPFTCIDDLLKVNNIFPGTINPRRHLMEV